MPDTQPIFTPTDILNIVKEHLKTVNTPVVIEGIYQKTGAKAYNGGLIWYDEIKSVYDNSKLKAMVPTGIREQFQDGDIVQLNGTISKSMNDYTGAIELIFRVSDFIGKKENVMTDEEKERMELLQKKAARGSKSVDTKLESILFADEKKPRVALMYAESSITDDDFRAGLQAASGQIDFEEVRQSFGDAEGFRQKIKELDRSEDYDVICLIRGGGSGLDVFDKVPMASVLLEMITPVITAIGHEQDNPLICKLSDRNLGTPSLLGQYFKDMVESVNEKKTKSHAALTEKIKKQFQKQLEAGQKQNDELQKKLATLTKNQEEATKKHNEQVEAANKQNKELQEKLNNLNKTQEEANKKHNEQVQAANKQNEALRKQLEDITKANKESSEQQTAVMKSMQDQIKRQGDTNTEQAKNLERTRKQLEEARRELGNRRTSPWVWVLGIACAILFVMVIILTAK